MMQSYLDILKSLQQSPTEASINDNQLASQEYNQNYSNGNYEYQQNYYHNNHNHVQSYIEYVPFKRKVLRYEERQYVERIPVVRKVYDHIQKIVVETVPRQHIETDYYAVQHLRYYKKQIIPEKTIQYVPVYKTVKKVQFIPVQRKILHYPNDIRASHIMNENFIEIQNNEISNKKNEIKQTFDKKVQIKYLYNKWENQTTPIRQYHFEQSQYGDKVIQQDCTSILNSLSKVYSAQPSTNNNQTSFDHTGIISTRHNNLRPSTLKQIKYKSTQTIDSKNLYSLSP